MWRNLFISLGLIDTAHDPFRRQGSDGESVDIGPHGWVSYSPTISIFSRGITILYISPIIFGEIGFRYISDDHLFLL